MYDIDEARQFLIIADVFFDDDEDFAKSSQTLNLNDTWGWAMSWGEYVKDEDLPAVAELFFRYGFGGLLYWVSRKNDNMRSEFHDVNRQLEFVATEEAIRTAIPNSSKRAYQKRTYTIGE